MSDQKQVLYQKNIKTNTVYAFRVVTGEEVIARVLKNADGMLMLSSPRVLVAQLRNKADGTPVFAAQILNWVNAAPDADVPVFYDSIISYAVAESDMEKEYIRFTSGIQLV